MRPGVQSLLGWVVALVVFVLMCGVLLFVCTVIPQPLPIDDAGKAFLSLALLGASPLVAGWVAWLAARTLRARLAGGHRYSPSGRELGRG